MPGPQDQSPSSTSRRGFLAASGAVAAAAAVGKAQAATATPHASGDDTIRVALVGCGGRGTGAVQQLFNTPGPIKLVAVADAFEYRVNDALSNLVAYTRRLANNGGSEGGASVDVPEDRRFVGLDAYRKAIATDCDLVVLATPPGFRPVQMEAAVNAGKHVFVEKPVAVDAPGIRRVMAAGEMAKKNNTAVAVGIQRRHEPRYIETVRRLHDGAIGDIVTTRVYWNSGGVWNRSRYELAQKIGHRPSELEYQVENWYYFNWLCGDHIAEQHIHNLDIGNWVHNGLPERAQGMGGRQVRTGKQYGQIFDHHAVEFTMPGGARMFSVCRHQDGCWNSVSEHAHGTKGTADVSAGQLYGPDGNLLWKYEGSNPQGHQQEQTDLVANLRKGVIQNEADYGASSTMTAILGRMATYSGRELSWADALASDLSLADDLDSWDLAAPVQPDEEGRYPAPTPGVTRVV